MTISVRRAGTADLDTLATMFDAYRRFYHQSPDPAGARHFLEQRMANAESVVLVAESGEKTVGFVQLYPGFSSVRMARVFVLNDLFVIPEVRGSGAGQTLLDAAVDHAREAGAVALSLMTTADNLTAQRLYEGKSWQRDDDHFYYDYPLER